jgi:hypothetical protein
MKRLIAVSRMFGKVLFYAGFIIVFAVACGVAGLLTACRPSALIPKNFYGSGHCFASDQPVEVFGSFGILGLILGTVAAVAFAFIRAGRKEETP